MDFSQTKLIELQIDTMFVVFKSEINPLATADFDT